MPINTCLSPLGSICSLKTYCSFPFVKEKQRVILYISSIPVQGLRFFGCWSLVFGPIACASLACQRAAAAHRGSFRTCVTTSWFSVFGLGSEHGCFHLCKLQHAKSVLETVPERKREPQTTRLKTVGKLHAFHLGIRKKTLKNRFIVRSKNQRRTCE